MKYVCLTCGKPFTAYHRDPKYCSRACYGKSCRDAVNEPLIIQAYTSGKSLVEVAAALGLTFKIVRNVLKRNGVPRRARKQRPGFGREKHHNWKGDKARYAALHLRVARYRGQPSRCELCGRSDSNRKYQWVNISGKHTDIFDYRRLCVSCQRQETENKQKYGTP